MIDRRYLDALRKICVHLDGSPVVWAVTGSLGMALQGMSMEVHDIDIQTDRAGAYEIEMRLSSLVSKKVAFSEAANIRSHFGELCVNGIRVEIMGDIQKRLEDGSWEEPVDPARYRLFVQQDDMHIPVMSLEYECQAYAKLGRTKKADMIRDWLRIHKLDGNTNEDHDRN
jgi:hypothetical protein